MKQSLSKLLRVMAFAGGALVVMSSATAPKAQTVIEDWTTPSVSTAGTVDPAGNTSITNPSGRWLVATNPVSAYTSGTGVLHFHGEHDAIGDGTLWATLQEYRPSNGMSVEVQFYNYCTKLANSLCFANIGIWQNDFNYRALGFKTVGSSMYLNIWGGTNELPFNGSAPYFAAYALTPTTHTFKIQYSKPGGSWQWDYFVDSIWVAGHPACPEDNVFYLGSGCFDGSHGGFARVELSYGSNDDGASPRQASEGAFGPISVSIW